MANKAIHVLAAAALILASCSNDDTVQVASGKGIRFRTTVGMNTRALPADLAGLKAAGFSVSAFATAGNEEKYGFRKPAVHARGGHGERLDVRPLEVLAGRRQRAALCGRLSRSRGLGRHL